VLCSGKVYYNLLEERMAREQNDVALIRLEQLYPFPEKELSTALAPYTQLQDIKWCQEEPMNQGAWYSSQHHMRRVVFEHNPDIHLDYVGREPSAAPAGGYMSAHLEEQTRFINDALTL
jgi:2-oxoglutarate dehydrogenase E1 component